MALGMVARGAGDSRTAQNRHIGIESPRVDERDFLVDQRLIRFAPGDDAGLSQAQVAAHRAHVGFWTKRASQHPEGVKFLQPLAIVDVSLAPRNVLGMAGLDQANLKAVFLQHLKKRNPVNSGRFHGDRLDLAPLEPFAQGDGNPERVTFAVDDRLPWPALGCRA